MSDEPTFSERLLESGILAEPITLGLEFLGGGADILRNRPRLAALERDRSRSGAIIRGRRIVRGHYICTTCGFCCFHHDGPVCQLSTWFRNDDGCCLCGKRGMLLDLEKPRMTWWVGRQAAMHAGHGDRLSLDHYLTTMQEFNLVPIDGWEVV